MEDKSIYIFNFVDGNIYEIELTEQDKVAYENEDFNNILHNHGFRDSDVCYMITDSNKEIIKTD